MIYALMMYSKGDLYFGGWVGAATQLRGEIQNPKNFWSLEKKNVDKNVHEKRIFISPAKVPGGIDNQGNFTHIL